MAEYIDRVPIIKKLEQKMASPETTFINTVLIRLLEGEPAADVVEVVRCKDCKYSTQSEASDDYWDCNDDGASYHESHYCAYGERRE
jgi:hypothetical protein